MKSSFTACIHIVAPYFTGSSLKFSDVFFNSVNWWVAARPVLPGNAGCGLVVGVLSGADSFEELMDAGAHMVCDRVTAPWRSNWVNDVPV